MDEEGFQLLGVAPDGPWDSSIPPFHNGADGTGGEAGIGGVLVIAANSGNRDDAEAVSEARRNSIAGEGGDLQAASAQEGTPVLEVTLYDVLCSSKPEALTLPKRRQILCVLLEDESRLFSPQYLKDHSKQVADLLGCMRGFAKTQRKWKKEIVAAQMIELNALMLADSDKPKRGKSSTVFLDFMANVKLRAKMDNEGAAAAAAKKRKAQGPSYKPKPGEVLQAKHAWDQSKLDALPCPACGHRTVMKLEIEGGKPSQEQRRIFKEAQAEWESLSKRQQRDKPKPTMKSLKLGGTNHVLACYCCTLSCTNRTDSCPQCKDNHPGFDQNNVCRCVQCRCQCQMVFDFQTRRQVAETTLNSSLEPETLIRNNGAIHNFGQMMQHYVRGGNLSLGLNPTNPASLADQQDSMALASMRMNADAALHANSALRYETQNQLGERPRAISVNGRLVPVSQIDQIRNDEIFARQLEQATNGPGMVGAGMVGPTSRRARQNGLSALPVDDPAKLTGGLTDAITNKNRSSSVYTTPPYARQRPGPAAVSQTAAVREAPAIANGYCLPIGSAIEVDHSPSLGQASAPALASQSSDARSRSVLLQVQQRLVTDFTNVPYRRFYRTVMEDEPFWIKNIAIYLGTLGDPPTLPLEDALVDDVIQFLMLVHSSPAKA